MRHLVWALPLVMAAATGGRATAEEVTAESVARGAYLFVAADCGSCHTDSKNGGAPLGGGRAIKTAFGTFYTPNISPDRDHGIGTWTDSQFIRAFRKGVSPDGRDYYPAFPYTSFTGMTDRDLLDLKAYLFSQPPVPTADRPHDLRFPYSVRWALMPWKILYFREGPFLGDASRSMEWNRGAYLVKAVTHCGECHSPRNALGAIDKARRFAGVWNGPDGLNAPNITPHPDGLGKWSTSDIEALLKDGITPNGDFVGSGMREVVSNTAKLSDADRHAIAVFLRALPPKEPTPKPAATASR
ncbi:diacylglycerol kinase [Aliidongia dinghuensis]|uniref:Diacylglycerol kinase n=1 Tax=Aliidongia dinghuensis TaxID=1867774 RepID=A0A8J2YU86_9PROT|nr:diacylglycerol kinase [Aliidongia dinghuensis]